MRPLLSLLLLLALPLARADVIECNNGDRYNGKVLSLDGTEVKLQNDIAGTLTIPRSRIVRIHLGSAPATPAPRVAGGTPSSDPQKLQFDAEAIERIQNEYLATATPEASQMFQEMVRGMQSGQMNLGDLRARAASTLRDLRAAQKESGEDALGGILETYGEVLESFLNQTAPGKRTPIIQPSRPQPKVAAPR